MLPVKHGIGTMPDLVEISEESLKMTSIFLVRLGPTLTPLCFSRRPMVREASLTEAHLAEVAQCRRDHNRLEFAYQVGFVRLFHRFEPKGYFNSNLGGTLCPVTSAGIILII
jgi:hypothetical protein